MALPIPRPFPPMEALSVAQIPKGSDWQYEPKWDGFRCLIFRDGRDVELQAKSGRSLTRYFPEIVEDVGRLKPRRFVIDSELIVPIGKSFSFDALLQRIHPASSRVEKLARETPALMIAFDLLVDPDGRSLIGRPLSERRGALERFFKAFCLASERLRVSTMTTDQSKAIGWLRDTGTALDGIIAKRRDLGYRSGDRTGMQKIKNFRTADCVVGGFRYNEGKPVVGSLLLGLYDPNGLLHHVGFTSTIRTNEKRDLTVKLERLISPPGFTGSKPGGPSRWATDRSSDWQPLKPKLVVEVRYDHFSGSRFRHGTKLLRWRPDKSPKQCKLDQVEQKVANSQVLLQ
jgi:ATP-dependent DNA ligase